MIALEALIGYFALLAVCFLILFCVVLYATTKPYPKVWRHKDENYFYNFHTGEREMFPSLSDDWSVHLSIIVPAYNEEERLLPMLDECIEYLEHRKRFGFTYEIIVVSDGSTDGTVTAAQNYSRKYDTVRVLSLVKNRGKGGAIRLGLQSARGSVLLFADADGATKFSDIEKLEASLQQILGCDYTKEPEKVASSDAVVCGSRAHLEKEETAKRSIFRIFLMHGFHFLVWLLCVRGIRDTQCGFKLLTRKTARTLFNALHVEQWAFDVEMLYIAQTLGLPITEIAVTWTEIDGSKVVPIWSWLQMGRDLGLIWLKYRIGAWKIAKVKSD
ncbi:dolichyl-phosphate beta-glucosyltransferase isoform X1 [Neodiprion virginianus]|uniref:dolichyl-phosphate beta-glucosyltransferase isoform X1 n=1 Tax=Neodiprion virginianus TaxID=2961670 RepID=UPI001EE70C20|nr:dolichyl-phosphate beta-glucosyltransferase isoform X1 [Neodiprion virginianus]